MIKELIPIDSVVKEFKDYLLTHPRSIFSAGFGEGKSYFLSEFQNCTKDTFQFITLYPVNYQVAENQDIFKLIKRDVFFQLFAKGIIQPSFPVSENVAVSFFLTNPHNYLRAIGEWMSELDYPSETVNSIVKPLVGFFKKMKECYRDYYKEKAVPSGENELEALLDYLEKDGVYECDAITQWIKEAISIWKDHNPGKKIVLLVEDLDRIDPAHIFRILNVLSAHIDYGYRFQVPVSKDSIMGNKYGFDNVICVVDHKNLKNIYHHFYGPRTTWEGYIEKFSSLGFFEYSLSDLKYAHYISLIANECGLPNDIVSLFFSKDILKEQTLRMLSNCIVNTYVQISEIRSYDNDAEPNIFPKEFLILGVILQRFGKTKGEIVSLIHDVVKENDDLKKFILPFFYIKHPKDEKLIYLGERERSYSVTYKMSLTHDKSLSFSKTFSLNHDLTKSETLLSLISCMLSYIKVG